MRRRETNDPAGVLAESKEKSRVRPDGPKPGAAQNAPNARRERMKADSQFKYLTEKQIGDRLLILRSRFERRSNKKRESERYRSARGSGNPKRAALSSERQIPY
jgi:hypothetical protein